MRHLGERLGKSVWRIMCASYQAGGLLCGSSAEPQWYFPKRPTCSQDKPQALSPPPTRHPLPLQTASPRRTAPPDPGPNALRSFGDLLPTPGRWTLKDKLDAMAVDGHDLVAAKPSTACPDSTFLLPAGYNLKFTERHANCTLLSVELVPCRLALTTTASSRSCAATKPQATEWMTLGFVPTGPMIHMQLMYCR
jgi:hypothetical protein